MNVKDARRAVHVAARELGAKSWIEGKKDKAAYAIVLKGVMVAADALGDARELRGHDARRDLRDALKAIIIRCDEGDPNSNWLPTISDIAKRALKDDPDAPVKEVTHDD